MVIRRMSIADELPCVFVVPSAPHIPARCRFANYRSGSADRVRMTRTGYRFISGRGDDSVIKTHRKRGASLLVHGKST